MSNATASSVDLPLNANQPEDIAIYNKRIFYVLDKTISRVKLVSVLKTLLSDENSLLWCSIPCDIKEKILQSREKYPEEEVILKEDDTEGEEGEALKAEVKASIIDHEMSKIIAHLESNVDLQELLKTVDIEESDNVKTFVKCLEMLRNGVEIHQGENAAQERARERQVKRFYARNDKIKKEITSLEEELTAKKTQLNTNILGKNLVINRHQSKIEKIQKASKEAIEKRVQSAEVAIGIDLEASKQVREALTSELEIGKQKYESLLADHLAAEKQLRLQRFKVENQLAAFMQKFDQDMRDKQAEEEELQIEFEEEKKKYEAVQKKLDEQEEEYDELMQEKAAYEQELLEQKLFIFILNRSARRIQRAFRAYKVRKLAKKKSKKGKKGKKK